MVNGHIILKRSQPLHGSVTVNGAKNAVLVIMTSLVLTEGESVLENVPNNADVRLMINLLQELGAQVSFDVFRKKLTVDTSSICRFEIKPEMMNKIRASILVMGPLLARFGKAKVALPGGDLIGQRPINYHIEGFRRMGAIIERQDPFVTATLPSYDQQRAYNRIVLEYPSVGATENLLMFACLGKGETVIINAALEPEVLDLIVALRQMGAHIEIQPGATLVIKGVTRLHPISHMIIPDRLEVGALMLAAAITGGELTITNAQPDQLDIFLEKLREMGHEVTTCYNKGLAAPIPGITFKATQHPQAVSIKTGPYPGFPTDLQPSMMAALCLAEGTSLVEETVYENRMIHAKELSKMGAQITVDGARATIRGVEALYGCEVIASDIRASCALVLGGMAAYGQTKMTGIHHWQRGYDGLAERLQLLGGDIQLFLEDDVNVQEPTKTIQTLP
jgi:UDP-N-acetylglucosamine 1-carboxyvinyltransferase